ncbi:MAG: Grx4 family monothiol glutaredoxin [Bdellovibrionales bacterium]|nr:Grx4 family monothiol glutaredoxin [Bdellovibrionales bacterium]
MTAREKIEDKIKNNKIVVFMKGTPDMPQCGFSAATVRCFQELSVPFESFDVLSDPEVREEVKRFSNWPTIPQVYIGGEFVGGCDIVREMYASGDLAKKVESVSN